ncbi:uncharacterized protein LOC126175654 [Schistocerca cancellata]|uniref:uncharacterized protein LOC126175654 n=1 Tax=Schistocerca cancellata TaxID=274614 RepID=UPI00211861D4|nr:uncharacterized protein LOC126175654 [Schistocerca cancellata]
MAPKKKRRRKAIADSGLGVSVPEKDAELIQKETCVQDGNLHRESELGENDGQLPQAGNSCLIKEKDPLATGQGFSEENNHPEITGDFSEKAKSGDTLREANVSSESSHPEITGESSEKAGSGDTLREANVSSEERACPSNKALQHLETDFSKKAAESSKEVNVSSQKTESRPNTAIQLLETDAPSAYINDSDSEKSMRQLLRIVNITSQVSDKGTELELPACTACAERSNNSHADSSETEIFVGTSREPRSSITSQRLHNDENFSLSKICASQKTGQCVAEGEEIEDVITSDNHDVPPVEHSLTVISHSCPEDIGVRRQILVSDRQGLPNYVLPPVGKKMPSRSKTGFQLYRPNFTGFRFSRQDSLIRESPEFVEQQNRGSQNEGGGGGSAQTLSVWSEAQSEYFPRGKPSDLGELLEVATRYVVKAWVKGIHPPISGPPTNLVIKFCVDCHKKYCHDENESNHLCSRRVVDSQKSLKLMFYVELEIYDETQETMKVALTGDQATKLFGCQPQEFIRNEDFQRRVWDSFKHLIKGGNRQNWCLKDAANFSLEPHLKGKKMNYRVVDIRPFNTSSR